MSPLSLTGVGVEKIRRNFYFWTATCATYADKGQWGQRSTRPGKTALKGQWGQKSPHCGRPLPSMSTIISRSRVRRSASSAALTANKRCTSGFTFQRGLSVGRTPGTTVTQPKASSCWKTDRMSRFSSRRIVRSPCWTSRFVTRSSLWARMYPATAVKRS